MNKRLILYTLTLLSAASGVSARESVEERMLGLTIPDAVRAFWQGRKPLMKVDPRLLAASMDWSSQDSPVKNQGSCGSCWAFAAVGLIENLGSQTDLAEQVIVSCADGSCGGGWYGDALEYIHNAGIPPEACYPYIAQNGDCSSRCDDPPFLEKVAQYDRWARWGRPGPETLNQLKSLLNSGPVIVHMLVPSDRSFDRYSGGIYDYQGSESIAGNRGHAVLVVGYNDSGEYFKVKNSWGSGWGENGYFRIAYNDVTDSVRFGGYPVMASGVYTEIPETESLTIPGTPQGEVNGITGETCPYETSGSESSLGHDLEYRFAWGDGSFSSWSAGKTASHVWTCSGSFDVTVTARCAEHTDVSRTSETLVVDINEAPETLTRPGIPQGEAQPVLHQTCFYETSGSESSLGHDVEYRFNWGDGSYSGWSAERTASHTWESKGTFDVRVTARCAVHTEITRNSNALTVSVQDPPETLTKPGIPQGSTDVMVGESYIYETSGASSNLGHDAEYCFSWGDGSASPWDSGKQAVHVWDEPGPYCVLTLARSTGNHSLVSVSDTLWIEASYPTDADENPVPGNFNLRQNRPNPFNPETSLQFYLPRDESVFLEVRNLLGQRIRVLCSDFLRAGQHERRWDGRDQSGRPVGAGIYIFFLRTASGTDHVKGILMK